ncbi:MAG: hypothetical protein QXS90_03305, partial [Candidatus Diapherotrites archaeon]
NGFSESGDPWFLNGLNVPSIEGFKNSVSSVAENNLENTLNDLSRARGYNFSNKSISVVSSNNTLQARAEVIASVKDGDIQKDFKIDNSFDLWPEALEMHSKMSEWSPEMANFNKEVAELIDSLGSCQIAQCACSSFENIPMNSPEKIDSTFFSANDFRPKLDALLSQKIARLNEKFVDSGISCRYEYKDLVIDRDITYSQVCFPTDNIPNLQKHWCITGRVRESNDPNFSIWWEMLEQKFPAKQIVRQNPEGFSSSVSMPVNSFKVCKDPITKDDQYTDERIVVNPKAYVDVAVICENPRISISISSGVESLKAEARFVAAVRQQCSINNLVRESNPDIESAVCGGKSSTPIIFCSLNSNVIPKKDDGVNFSDDYYPYIENGKEYSNDVCFTTSKGEKIKCVLECDKLESCNTPCMSYACVRDELVPPDKLAEGFGRPVETPRIKCDEGCDPNSCDNKFRGCLRDPMYCSPSSDPKYCGADRTCTIVGGTYKCVVTGTNYIDCTQADIPNCKVASCYLDNRSKKYSCSYNNNKDCPPVNSIPYFCDPADGICKPQYIG